MQTVVLNSSAAGRRYGAFPSWHDPRDYSLPYRVRAMPRAPSADLSAWLGPVKDQTTLGACTGFGATGQMEFLYRKYKAGSGEPVFSPLSLYWNERDIEGDVDSDGGAQIRTACKVLASRGVCLESDDPYRPSAFRAPPTPPQIAEAAKYKAGGYHRLNDLPDMLSCLASGYPFLMGFVVYESFERIGGDGVMSVPGRGEFQLGGHCVLVYGYDDAAHHLLVRNSWGTGWGKGGNFSMPYAFASDAGKVFDTWITHLGKPW